LPPDLDAAAILAGAVPLGVALDEAQAARLIAYAGLLERWNATHNLTAIRGGEAMLTHHLLDSLSLAPRVAGIGSGAPARVLDVGSGGGLPGIVLAIALPQARLTLVDAVRKKCAFLTQAKLELGLVNVEVVHGRVEAIRQPPFDAIVSRALATLAQFVGWTRHLLRPGGCWLAMKGKLPAGELAALPPDLRATVTPLTVPGLREERHLVEMRIA
jgi:16S rRNA (guanine527-N7)-methyltransferase